MVEPSASHYEVLGIGPRATQEQIERAYRFALELYGDGALATYSLLDPEEVRLARTRVQEAYDVLRDPGRRYAYDMTRGLASPSAPRIPAPANGPIEAPPAIPANPPSAAPPEKAEEGGHRRPRSLEGPVTGAALRRFREEQGISLREIANRSKVGTRYLEYIEQDRHDLLPAPVYLRGFLQEYAKVVGLDPQRTASAYMSQFPRPWPAG